MNAKEAKIRSMESRSRLVTEQLKTVHRSIDIAVKEGRISTRVLDIYPSVCNVGWLDEVVEKLKDEGYTVNLVHDLLIVEWGDVKEVPPKPSLEAPKLPSILIKEGTKIEGAFDIPPRPYKDPHMIKEDGGGILAMVLTGLVISGLILLGLMFG